MTRLDPALAPGRPDAPARTSGLSRRLMLGAGVGLLAASVAGGGYIAWEVFGDPLVDPAVASEGVKTLQDSWAAPAASGEPAFVPANTVPGNALALLRIPDFGASFQVPIVFGTDPDSLHKGVGWFTDTAQPGQIGNFAIAGHRGAKGPFVPLPGLMPGARIEVETRDTLFVYTLDNHPADLTIVDTELWVIDPVPGKPVGTTPTQALITLITCADFVHPHLRAVGFGHLTETIKKNV